MFSTFCLWVETWLLSQNKTERPSHYGIIQDETCRAYCRDSPPSSLFSCGYAELQYPHIPSSKHVNTEQGVSQSLKVTNAFIYSGHYNRCSSVVGCVPTQCDRRLYAPSTVQDPVQTRPKWLVTHTHTLSLSLTHTHMHPHAYTPPHTPWFEHMLNFMWHSLYNQIQCYAFVPMTELHENYSCAKASSWSWTHPPSNLWMWCSFGVLVAQSFTSEHVRAYPCNLLSVLLKGHSQCMYF